MHVAVTGATGFLGLHLVAALVEAGHHVTALVRDPKRLGALEALVNTRQISLEDHAALVATLADHDALVHAALVWDGHVPPNTAPPEKPELAARDTAVAATLFDAAGAAGVKRVVYLSSVAVHRPFRAVEQGEMTEKDPLAPSDLYGATKAAAELFLAAAAASFGFVGTALRLGPVVGPPAFPGAKGGTAPPGGRQLLGTNALRRIVLAALAATDDAWAGPVLCVDGEVTQWAEIAALSGVARAPEPTSRAGGIAHDFNNMLGVVLSYTELAMEGIAPSLPLYNDLEEVRKAATRSADLTRQLLAFARRQTVVPKVLDLNETVAGMLKMLERLLGENIRIHWRPGTQLWPTKIDPSQVDQILANLCVNARDAIADVGKLTIETENKSLAADDCTHVGGTPGDYVKLAVSDNGLGMDRETRARIFEPFFTTKEVGKGTGLGLATVYGIIRQNGGFIDVESELGRGTTFSLYLPRHFGITDHGAQTAVRPALGGHETILLVEDEPAILKVTKRMLEGLGFHVLAASTAVDAIRLARENSQVHLLLADVIMPDRNGRDLANALLALFPNLKRMFMSGYTADVLAQHGVAEDGLNFIQKPFTKAELAAKVRETLDGTTRTPQVQI